MTSALVLGRFADAPGRPLVSVGLEVVPLDLVTEWQRCGAVADFLAAYMSFAFERRGVAHSVLSTVGNELVENATKFSADKRAPTRVALLHHGEEVHAEVRNEASDAHVARLREVLEALARDGAEEVFRGRMASRSGLGLALIARDYDATVGARITPGCMEGRNEVCLRVALSVLEVEQR